MGKAPNVKVKIGQSSELDVVVSLLDNFAKSVTIYICTADDHDDILPPAVFVELFQAC